MGTQFDRGLPAATRVLVVDADDALFGLIEEWLGAAGHDVIPEHARDARAHAGVDLVVVDIPFPRQGRMSLLERVAAEHPGIPILALSSTFFAGIGSNGAVARALGVAGVLPKPVSREGLIAAVADALTSPK